MSNSCKCLPEITEEERASGMYCQCDMVTESKVSVTVPVNVNQLRINRERFSVRLNFIAEYYGMKTIGQLSKLLKGMNPNSRIYFGVNDYTRVSKIKHELESFNPNNKSTIF